MRILIVSVTTGYGHHSAAAAIADELRSRGNDVVIADLYEYISPFIYNAVDKGYLFYARHLHRPFSQTYTMLETNEKTRKLASAIAGNSLICRKFSQFFDNFSPDAIIATHVLSALVLDGLKERGELTMPIIGIVTDYCLQLLWEDVHNIDYIVTASELLSFTAVAKGIPAEKLLPFGLPVNPKFRNNLSRSEARRLLGISDKDTVLVMGGSMGYGSIGDTVKEILDCGMDLQILCVCGTNDKLRRELSSIDAPELRVYGFMDNVEVFMDAADCIITKPGGLTITELLVKGLPAILMNPIPGHEERNMDFIANIGGAIKITEYLSVSEAVYYLFSCPRRLELMSESLRLIAKPDATERLCDFVEALIDPAPAD